jgi:hypothetical protein
MTQFVDSVRNQSVVKPRLVCSLTAFERQTLRRATVIGMGSQLLEGF